jgi:hypothetical protein
LDRRHQSGRAVSASVVVEVLAPGHHNRPCPGFGGEVVSGQHLVFQTSWRPGPGWASLPFLPLIRQPP